MVVEESGRTVAVFGLYARSTRYVLFSSLTDEIRKNKRLMVKGIRAVLDCFK
jgi:hypothetical protein